MNAPESLTISPSGHSWQTNYYHFTVDGYRRRFYNPHTPFLRGVDCYIIIPEPYLHFRGHMNLRAFVPVLMLASFPSVSLFGQSATATFVGTVLDSSGGTVPAANVQIKKADTGESRQAQTDSKGEFTVADLAPGIYDVTIAKEGFRAIRESGLELQIDQTARMDFHLDVGAMTQTVEVTGVVATVPTINTENGVKGEVMTNREIIEMPLNGRDFTDLAVLVPGVSPRASGGQGSGYNINGARADNTNFVIDGFNDQNPRGAAAQARPNIDALQEFKMQTSNYSAENGRLAGGVMNMVIKSGTNKYHGTLFEFLRNDFFDARGFFDGSTKSHLRQNQFGGVIGGPITVPKVYSGHDRTFFLFSWETYRQNQGQSKVGLIPTPAQIAGNFSGFKPIADPLASGSCPGPPAAPKAPVSRTTSFRRRA